MVSAGLPEGADAQVCGEVFDKPGHRVDAAAQDMLDVVVARDGGNERAKGAIAEIGWAAGAAGDARAKVEIGTAATRDVSAKAGAVAIAGAREHGQAGRAGR